MARFETWSDVCVLFLGAGCVGLLMVVLLQAEATKRAQRETERETQGETEGETERETEGDGEVVETRRENIRGVWEKILDAYR